MGRKGKKGDTGDEAIKKHGDKAKDGLIIIETI